MSLRVGSDTGPGQRPAQLFGLGAGLFGPVGVVQQRFAGPECGATEKDAQPSRYDLAEKTVLWSTTFTRQGITSLPRPVPAQSLGRSGMASGSYRHCNTGPARSECLRPDVPLLNPTAEAVNP